MSHNGHSLSILYYNARSLVCNIDNLRANYLLHHPDIVCIVESWLDSDIENSELHISDYQFVRHDRNRHGGGIGAYVSQNLPFTLITKGIGGFEYLSFSVNHTSKTGVLIVYRPPSSPLPPSLTTSSHF